MTEQFKPLQADEDPNDAMETAEATAMAQKLMFDTQGQGNDKYAVTKNFLHQKALEVLWMHFPVEIRTRYIAVMQLILVRKTMEAGAGQDVNDSDDAVREEAEDFIANEFLSMSTRYAPLTSGTYPNNAREIWATLTSYYPEDRLKKALIALNTVTMEYVRRIETTTLKELGEQMQKSGTQLWKAFQDVPLPPRG